MSTINNLKKLAIGALISAGVVLPPLGLTAGIANAAPQNPNPTIDHSDYAGPIVECNQCGRTLPGDGSVRVNPVNPGVKVRQRPAPARRRSLRRPLTSAEKYSSPRHRSAGGGPSHVAYDIQRFVYQSRQNSLPSMSCITMQDSSPSPAGKRRTRVAPSATSRAHSASSAARRPAPTIPVPTLTSRCTRFFHDLVLGHPLDEQPRPHACGIDARVRAALFLRGQRAVERIPIGEPLGRRRHDVAEHLAPEASDALRHCAVERHLKLPDHHQLPPTFRPRRIPVVQHRRGRPNAQRPSRPRSGKCGPEAS